MKKSLTYLLFYCAIGCVWGQDIHFTQLNGSAMTVNPAFTGVFSGWERVSINHKNQWVNAGTKFFTTAIAVDFNLYKSPRKESAYLGFGLQMYRDVGGDSRFGTKQVLGSVSGVVPIAENNILALGFQVGMGQKSGNYTNLLFPNQFDGEKLNASQSSFESPRLNSSLYPDLSFGLLYQYNNANRSVIAESETVFNFGVSVFHFNKPSIKYLFGTTEKLSSKIVFNTSLRKDFPGTLCGIEAYINQYIQDPHRETLLAALFRYKYRQASRITGLKKKVEIGMGIAYRVNDAISPIFKLEVGPWTFGTSYDVTISKLGRLNRGGGLEFSVTYNNADFALFKRRY